jgi:hypothetical protein
VFDGLLSQELDLRVEQFKLPVVKFSEGEGMGDLQRRFGGFLATPRRGEQSGGENNDVVGRIVAVFWGLSSIERSYPCARNRRSRSAIDPIFSMLNGLRDSGDT